MGISHSYPTVFTDWQNAFLSGNGKMGIMVFGNPLHETVIYNDRKFNLAKTHDRSFAEVSHEDIMKIRKLCAAGDFEAANRLAVSSAHYQGGGEGNRHPGFEMLIDIPSAGETRNYSRICNFRTGEVIIRWTDSRGDWERKSFVSRKDNVIVQYITAPSKGPLDCTIQLAIDTNMLFPAGMHFTNVSNASYLNMRVAYPQGTNGAGYEGVTRVVVNGGSKNMKGNTLQVSHARSVILLTRIDKYYENSDAAWSKQLLQQQLAALSSSYDQLLKGQIATHQAIYDRVKLDLNAPKEDRALPNEALLEKQKKSVTPVNALWERVFDAGRYYFLSSSSEDTPPDLLGIWAGDCNAGWGGYYHLDANLNLQVAGANIGNMSEAMEGYVTINESWARDFEVNAKKLLGCRGLLACGNTPGSNAGLMANVSDYYPYQYATGEEGWLLYPIWEHYLVTGDTAFLRKRLYPLLRKMGDFYEDFLSEKDSVGHYIFAGSVSPENQPSNLKISLLNNSAFDISGAKFSINALLESCQTLSLEQGAGEGVERWTALLQNFPPYLINEEGAIKEWSWPGLKDNYDHRHSSHLLSVWPFHEITKETTPALFQAAQKTLALKDAYNYGTGHGLLHSALIAAGLNNEEAVRHKLLRLLQEDFYYCSLCTSHNPQHNTFCTDICNTVPAVMMEMLVASEPGVLELLPALPKELNKGSIIGMKGRNRVTIEQMHWDMSRRSIDCVLRSTTEQDIALIERQGIKDIATDAISRPSVLGNIAKVVHLPAGKSIAISIRLDEEKKAQQ